MINYSFDIKLAYTNITPRLLAPIDIAQLSFFI